MLEMVELITKQTFELTQGRGLVNYTASETPRSPRSSLSERNRCTEERSKRRKKRVCVLFTRVVRLETTKPVAPSPILDL